MITSDGKTVIVAVIPRVPGGDKDLTECPVLCNAFAPHQWVRVQDRGKICKKVKKNSNQCICGRDHLCICNAPNLVALERCTLEISKGCRKIAQGSSYLKDKNRQVEGGGSG